MIGAQIGDGSERDIAIALGVIAGSMIGASVGRYMDEQDHINTAIALEKNRTGEASTWQNPDSGNSYAVTPTRTYEATAKKYLGLLPPNLYQFTCAESHLER